MHKHVLDLIPFYLSGRLSDHEKALVRDHIAECKVCHRAYLEWQIISTEVYRNAESWSQPLPVLNKRLLPRQSAAPARQYSVSAVLWTGIAVLVLAVVMLSNQYQTWLSPNPTTSHARTDTPTLVIFPPPTSTIVILPTLKGPILRDPPVDRCVAQSPSTGLVNIYRTPQLASEVVAQLYPGEYLVVAEMNAGGWYKVLGRDSSPVGWVWNHDAVISGTACTDLSRLPDATGTSTSQP